MVCHFMKLGYVIHDLQKVSVIKEFFMTTSKEIIWESEKSLIVPHHLLAVSSELHGLN